MRRETVWIGLCISLLLGSLSFARAGDLEFIRSSKFLQVNGLFDNGSNGGSGSGSASLTELIYDGQGGMASVSTTAQLNGGGAATAGAFENTHQTELSLENGGAGQATAGTATSFSTQETVTSPIEDTEVALPVKLYFETDWADTGLLQWGNGPVMEPVVSRQMICNLSVSTTSLLITSDGGVPTAEVWTAEGGPDMYWGTTALNAVSGDFSIMIVHYDAHHGDPASLVGWFEDLIGTGAYFTALNDVDDYYGGIWGANFNMEILEE